MIADSVTLDLDSEILAAEQRACDLRAAKERRRGELQIRLRVLQNQLSAVAAAPPPGSPNADPHVMQLHAAFCRAQDALRVHQRRRPHCGVPPQHWLTDRDYRAEIERHGAASRAFEERTAALLADGHKARAAYSAAVDAKINELRAAEEAAQQQRAIAAAEVRQQIAATEAELLRLGR